MDFAVSDRMQGILRQVRRFVEEELFPLEEQFLLKSFAELEPILHEKRQKVKEMGLWLPQLEEEWGGMGLSLSDFGLIGAELGRSPIGHFCFNCQAPDSGNMEVLVKYGTEEQKEKYLRPLAEGKIRSCFSMTEPEHAGSNPVWMSTTAVLDGDEWVLNGHKWFTSSADGAAFAIVMAVTDREQAPHLRASMIIVPTDTPGFTIERNTPCMGHVGDSWASHAEIRYENCRVPKENLLGPQCGGFMIAQERLGPGRIHHCMRWIGVCQRSFELMCQRAVEREVAPGEYLGAQQFIRGWIAESKAEIDAARLLVLHAAWKIEHVGQKEARDEVSAIKFFVANTMQRVVDRAVQAHGGLGITDYTPLAHFYRNERAARIYDGPDEVHKISLGRRVLKKYRGL
jgi:alkylation response protein AidB-like acyl-CoA dehydrogenase